MIELEKAYDASKTETAIYKKWLNSGYFTPENLPHAETRKPYTIAIPPPNVTGTLHIGHAARLTTEDILIRFRRMQGYRALWIPGTDHATIATESKVTKLLDKEGIKKKDLGREEFVKRVEEFAQNSHDTIVNQTRSMGASVDWTREAYTFDEPRSYAVRTAFKTMYDGGLIYRGNRVVNWDPKGQTVISDDEVVHQERNAKLYTFKYSADFPISISSTRPETKVGDTAVAVHPEDKRYQQYVGQEYDIEFCGVPIHIKIIADETVEKDFGTGALGVTPAHSISDFEMSQRHNLALKQVINEYGKMIVGDKRIIDKKTTEAREAIVDWLKQQNLLEKEEDIKQNVGTAERTGAIIEPLPKLQWFIDVNKPFAMKDSHIAGINTGDQVTLKQLMRHVVETGAINIIPDYFNKTYFHWIDNLRDWCISRQLWFGHRVPVWYRVWNKVDLTKLYIMGFHERTIPQVYAGKSVTYRLRDHGVEVGQQFALQNTQANAIFGYGTIVDIKKTTVGETPLNDPAHSATYSTRQELIEAFQFHHKNIEINESTPVWIYSYSFAPVAKEIKEMYVGIEPPPGADWEQDSDTLDSWFSSGLWTFSILGWPENTTDLQTYHPTDVLETGHDILFFWVARMILMTTYLLGDIPFRTVFLSGLIRDADRQKMSKSKGNIIDPLLMNEKYGTDAVRFALIFNTAPGTDMALAEDKIKGMKHFANKLWNIARFILMNVDIATVGFKDDDAFSPEDESMIKDLGLLRDTTINTTMEDTNLARVIDKVTKDLETFMLHEAAQAIYNSLWYDFADKYIEYSKIALNGNDENDKRIKQTILYQSLLTYLKLLHPFMPFVTEEIWSKLSQKDLLIIEPWPKS